AHAAFDLHTQLALARGGTHRRGLVDDGGQAGAVIVDVAGKYQRRAGRFGGFDRRIGHGQRQPFPLRVARVEGVHDDVHAARALDDRDAVERLQHLRAVRRPRGRAGTHLRGDAPAGLAERLTGGDAEPAGRPEHKNTPAHAERPWAACNAWSRSAPRSSGSSSPTESRSRSGGHGESGPSTEARCSIRLSTPPSEVARFHSSTLAAAAMAACSPPLTRIDSMPPKPVIWRAATAWPGWVDR